MHHPNPKKPGFLEHFCLDTHILVKTRFLSPIVFGERPYRFLGRFWGEARSFLGIEFLGMEFLGMRVFGDGVFGEKRDRWLERGARSLGGEGERDRSEESCIIS